MMDTRTELKSMKDIGLLYGLLSACALSPNIRIGEQKRKNKLRHSRRTFSIRKQLHPLSNYTFH